MEKGLSSLRICILTDEYLPNGTRAHSRILHDLALELKDLGKNITIITPGTLDQNKLLDIQKFEGINIWKFKSGQIRGRGLFLRLVNEFLLSFWAWYAIKKYVKKEPFELCISWSPTIFFGILNKKLAKSGTYIYLVLRDIFPQWAIDKGIIKEKSIAAKFFRFFEKLNYSSANLIALQSNKNLEFFKTNNPNFHNLDVLMNWQASKKINKSFNKFFFQKKYNLPNKILLFYGGNIGLSQDMSNIMKLAKNLLPHKQAHFLIVGDGDEFNLINKLKKDWYLKNVTILPSVSQSEYINLLYASDIGLFSLSRNHSTHNFPGKTLAYMNASIPILGSVNIGNDLQNIINDEKAGFVHINGEDDALMLSAIDLVNNSLKRLKFGENAKKLLDNKFSAKNAANSILKKYEDDSKEFSK